MSEWEAGLRARISEVVDQAHAEAERASQRERELESRRGEDPNDIRVLINHRASAIAWTAIANAFDRLLDADGVGT